MIKKLPSLLPGLVKTANLAPSVHNTQPAKWHVDDRGDLFLLLDRDRLLGIGDPTRHDALLSCGTALEGMRLACLDKGLNISGIDRMDEAFTGNNELLARIDLCEADCSDPLSACVSDRFTWRGGFVEAATEQRAFLEESFALKDDVTLVTNPVDIRSIADMNDEASLHFLSNREYRRELHDWMRLNTDDSNWSRDGLNSQALCLGSFEAKAADVVLGGPAFDILNKLRLGKMVVSEKAKTCSSTAIMLFHRPVEEHAIDTGVAYYRAQLELAAQGLTTWPMAVLADAEDSRHELVRKYRVPEERRLVNVLRIGKAPENANPGRARLKPAALIV